MAKLVVIVGVTGNQGGSVAARFLQDPTYRIRGLTRDPSSPRAQSLATQGVEIVRADLDDASTLAPAFAGASLIFSVTNYWSPSSARTAAPTLRARAFRVASTPARSRRARAGTLLTLPRRPWRRWTSAGSWRVR